MGIDFPLFPRFERDVTRGVVELSLQGGEGKCIGGSGGAEVVPGDVRVMIFQHSAPLTGEKR